MIDVFQLARYGSGLPAPLASQGAFETALASLSRTLNEWMADASGRIADARSGPPEDVAIVEREWSEPERRAREAVRRFAEAVDRQPTAATMGKVNAGKTLMLSKWYGDSDDLRELPVGDADTTGCLTRLTRRGAGRLDAAVRVRTLDNSVFVGNALATEDAATLDEFPGTLYVGFEPGNRDEYARALRVCRFPTADDANYELEEVRRGEYRVVRLRSGELRLRSLQLRASEVTLRVHPKAGTRAGRIFEVLDIVDCPGADPQIETDAARHLKAVKNHLVFRQAIDELDLLLLVCSSQPSAIRPGHQLLHGPWRQWVERCDGHMRGRVVLALTYAGEALRHSADRFRALSRPESERQINTQQSLPQSVFSSVVQPLRGSLDEPWMDALDPNDLTTWPPFVLIENRHVDADLEIAAADIPRARAAVLAALDDHGLPDDPSIPFPWRVVHFFARSWVDDVARVRAAEPDARRRFLEWMVEVALAVANPEDRGHELLTRLMLHLAHRGELRRAKCAELVALGATACASVTDLQERLTREPRADRAALDAIDELATGLRAVLPRQGIAIPFPASIRQACLRPFGTEPITWDGLVSDCVRSACASVQAVARRPDLIVLLRPVLERMLETDGPTLRLRAEEERFLGDEPSNAVRCTHFVTARLAAAMEWLMHADGAAREDYAARALGIDPKRGEAYKRLRRVVGELAPPEHMADALTAVQELSARLTTELDAAPVSTESTEVADAH